MGRRFADLLSIGDGALTMSAAKPPTGHYINEEAPRQVVDGSYASSAARIICPNRRSSHLLRSASGRGRDVLRYIESRRNAAVDAINGSVALAKPLLLQFLCFLLLSS